MWSGLGTTNKFFVIRISRLFRFTFIPEIILVKHFILLTIVFNLAYSGFTQAKSEEERLRKLRLYANYGMEANTSDEAAKIFEHGLYFSSQPGLTPGLECGVDPA